jgi:two-component system, chemotaxis family, protein-glutamate methylesterase/glutaminase
MAERNPVNRFEVLLIGGSAGSVEAILQILPSLPVISGLAIVVVLHRRSGESLLPELLSGKTAWTVKEAEEKDSVEPGTIYLAPADYHLLIEKDKSFSLDDSEKVNHSRPSIDVTFESAADVFGSELVCLLLSGANADGVKGLLEVKRKGGRTLAQDPSTATVPFMPQQAIDNHAVDYIMHKNNISDWINQLSLQNSF